MSHSKFIKRGKSLYLEKWNPEAKKYINTCAICGHRGYSPMIDADDFCHSPENRQIYKELSKVFCKMGLDGSGRCEECARVQDGGFRR